MYHNSISLGGLEKMVSTISKARAKARHAIESLYEHTCTIVEYKKVKDEVTKVTDMKEVSMLEDHPCKLSHTTVKASNQTESVNQVQQVIKLFISPDVEIKEGSKIIVMHNDRVSEYKNSGVPSVFPTHQEIVLERFEGWA